MAIISNVTAGSVLTATTFNSLPRGLAVKDTASASDQTGITAVADVTGVSATFTAVASRYYVLVGFAVVSSSAGSPALQTLQITDSGAATIYAREITHFTAGGGNLHTVDCESEPLTFSAGSTTIKLRFGRSGGDSATYTVNNSTMPAWLAVYDVGST